MNGEKLMTCAGKLEIPTEKEKEALGALKSIKERVRAIKGLMVDLKAEEGEEPAGKMAGLETELTDLKAEWNHWEEKRRLAERERMIILGHEKET